MRNKYYFIIDDEDQQAINVKTGIGTYYYYGNINIYEIRNSGGATDYMTLGFNQTTNELTINTFWWSRGS